MPLSQISQFRNRANVGLLVLAFVVIVITSVVSVRSINALRDAIGWVSHTRLVQANIYEIQLLLGRMESGGLRYMIDGKAGHREILVESVEEIPAKIIALRSLVGDNPEHREAVDALERDQKALMARVRESLEIKADDARHGDGQNALRRVRDGHGEQIVLRMNDRLNGMLLAEKQLLQAREAERDTLVKQTNATLLIANGLALVAGLLGFLALRRAQREEENIWLVELRASQARRASEEKSAFLANMSHEIRTPMNAIFGFAQLLADHVDEPLQREWVASIRRSGQVLLSLINDVLDVSKIEAGKLQLAPQGTDIAELVEDTVAMFLPMAEAKGIGLQCEIVRDGLVPVSIDPQRFRQILMNLVSNAVKYTERGRITVGVEMRPAPLGDGHDLRLRVQDTGTGIDPEEQSRIFEPFYQAGSLDGKVRQGTGLGLSITHLLVTLMQGRIHVLSRPGEGTTFQIDLPQLPFAEPAASVTLGLSADGVVDFDRLPPLRILVVDDVDWNIQVAHGYLRGSAHTLAFARDGVEAIMAARDFRPDVVLMDLRMPRMDGRLAAQQLREDPAWADLSIVAVTASSLLQEQTGVDPRFDGYVRKPYSPAELYECLHALFGERAGNGDAVEVPMRTPQADEGAADQRAEALAEWEIVRAAPLEALRRRMRVREIGEFSRRLDTLADAIGDPALREEARALRLAVQRFDVSGMKTILERLAHHPDLAAPPRVEQTDAQ